MARPDALLPLFLLLFALSAGCTDDPAPRSLQGEDGDPAAPVAPAVAGPRTEVVQAEVPVTVATPLYVTDGTDGSFNGVDLAHLLPTPGVTGYVVEVTWTPVDPVHAHLAVWVRGHTGPAVPPPVPDWVLLPAPESVTSGASPLHVAIDAATLLDPDGYTVFVRAADEPVGVTLAQPIEAFVSVFENATFDPSFSALR